MRLTDHKDDQALVEADRRLKRAFAMAEARRNPNAMVSAAIALCRLHGLDAETQMRLRTDKGSDVTPTEYLRQLADMLPD